MLHLIDVNGILRVTAEDKATGNKNGIVINNNRGRLSQDEIEKMVKNAEKYAEEDKVLKEKIDAKNDLETYAYQLKNQMNDKEKLGGKLTAKDRETLSKGIEGVLEWLEQNTNAEAV